MRSARYDQIYFVPVANKDARKLRGAGANPRLLDREFGDEYRSPRLSAKWFILPSAMTWLVLMSIFLF